MAADPVEACLSHRATQMNVMSDREPEGVGYVADSGRSTLCLQRLYVEASRRCCPTSLRSAPSNFAAYRLQRPRRRRLGQDLTTCLAYLHGVDAGRLLPPPHSERLPNERTRLLLFARLSTWLLIAVLLFPIYAIWGRLPLWKTRAARWRSCVLHNNLGANEHWVRSIQPA